MQPADRKVFSPSAARAEITRRVDEALANDDGEPYSAELVALAARLAGGDRGIQIQRELSAIIRSKSSARDQIEAIALLSWAQDDYAGIPASLARAPRLAAYRTRPAKPDHPGSISRARPSSPPVMRSALERLPRETP